MSRLTFAALLAFALAAPACRGDSAAITTTSTTRPLLGVVIAACRVSEETITLLNQANSARNLDGWVLHDEGKDHVAPLGTVLIDHARTVVFMYGRDAIADNRGEVPLFASLGGWLETGDTVHLLNRQGELVDSRECN